MPDISNQTRVAAIVAPGPTHQQITTALGSQPDFKLVDVLSALEKIVQEIRALQPQIILVDHQVGEQSTLDTLDELALEFPEIALVAILPASDLLSAQQAMLAGARAFIIQPFTQVNLLSTLRRVRDLEARRRVPLAAAAADDTQKPLQVISVYGPRGGAGCSTVATNLAVALREETDGRVLLLEGKLLFGHLGLMLNIRASNSIADLVPHMHALEESMVRDVVADHSTGIQVLLSPANAEVAQGIRPETLYNIIHGLRPLYDFIVIDAGSYLSDNTVTLLDSAERVLLIATPDLAALHDASRFIQLSRSLAYPAGKVSFVLNRAGLPGGVRTRDIESALHHEVFAEIPDDGPNALRSLNRGIPVLLKYPRSPVSRAIQRLAKTLAGVGRGEPARAAGQTAAGGTRRAAAPARASKASVTY
ncbi:MAG: AAA family ATPase [Chloroflexota bacterium]